MNILQKLIKYNLIFILFISLDSCNGKIQLKKNNFQDLAVSYERWGDYWFQGKAEIASYELRQSRYGEIHEGTAVLIFVKEDFSRSKQVKLDHPEEAGSDKVSILKVNFIKNFTTGIYPYSMMMSVFSPIKLEEDPRSLKVSMSSQEWCGHVFSQLNLEGGKFRVQEFSYFESEGDNFYGVKSIFLEDEIWNRIKIDPGTLPTGEIDILPGLFFTRLTHSSFEPVKAMAALNELPGGMMEYALEFPDHDRNLIIRFEKQFPYRITYWEETYPGSGGKTLTTTAKLKKTLFTDYWNKNHKKDDYLRDSLDLK